MIPSDPYSFCVPNNGSYSLLRANRLRGVPRLRPKWVLAALGATLLALGCHPGSARANVAGGKVSGFTQAVTYSPVTYNSTPCEFVDNGIIHAIIRLANGDVVSLKYLKPASQPGDPLDNGVEMVNHSNAAGSNLGDHTSIYYSASENVPFGNYTFSSHVTTTGGVTTQVDLAFTHIYNPSTDTYPWDTVVHWVLLQGDTGMYTYLETNHPSSYAGAVFGQTTLGWPMANDGTNFLLENNYIDHLGDGLLDNRGKPDTRRNGLSPSYADGINTASPSGTLNINAPEQFEITNSGPFLNFFDSKYAYDCDYATLGCWGRASDVNHLGGWFVLGSPESLNNGPTVEDYV